jgi:hypothetical protein
VRGKVEDVVQCGVVHQVGSRCGGSTVKAIVCKQAAGNLANTAKRAQYQQKLIEARLRICEVEKNMCCGRREMC